MKGRTWIEFGGKVDISNNTSKGIPFINEQVSTVHKNIEIITITPFAIIYSSSSSYQQHHFFIHLSFSSFASHYLFFIFYSLRSDHLSSFPRHSNTKSNTPHSKIWSKSIQKFQTQIENPVLSYNELQKSKKGFLYLGEINDIYEVGFCC